MRNLLKAAIAATALVSSSAFAGVSANIGYVTDYYYRGANLGDAGTYAGLDFESDNGFYAGTWAIDDGAGGNDGLEIDFYAGYGLSLGTVDLGISYTLYTYTYTDDSESELGLSLAAGNFSLDFALGNDDDEESGPNTDEDYTVITAGLAIGASSITAGSIEYDTTSSNDWTYFEYGYGFEAGGFDIGFALGVADFDDGDDTNDEPYMLLDFSKGFDL